MTQPIEPKPTSRTDLIRSKPPRTGNESGGSTESHLADEAPAQPEFAGDGKDRLLHTIRRRGVLCTAAALVVSAIVAASVWYLKSESYTSTAVLRLSSTDATLMFNARDTGQNGPGDFKEYKKLQRLLFRNRNVFIPVLRDLDLSKVPALEKVVDPIDWLEKNLVIKFPDDTELMTVSLSASQPGGLEQLINAMVDYYIEEVVNQERQQKLQRLNGLDLTYQKFEDKLRTKQTELNKVIERTGSWQATKLTPAQETAKERYAGLRKELQSVQLELMQLELELNDPQELSDNEQADQLALALQVAARTDPELQRMKAEKERAELHIKELKRQLTSAAAAPKVKEQNQRLQALGVAILQREAHLRSELIEYRRRTVASNRESGNRRSRQLKAQEKQITSLLAEHKEAANLPQASTDVDMMQIDVDVLSDVVKQILQEIERTKVELQPDFKGISSRVSRLSPATPARITDTQAKTRTAVIAAAIGFFLPLILLVWLGSRNDRIYSKEEVVHSLGLPVIGAVPLVPRNVMRRLGDRRTKKAAYWRGRLTESVDSIAAMLLRGTNSRSLQVVMVTSSSPGEGKTTLAANLATSLAAAGRRTALVDCDLRRPALHRLFDLPRQPGVCELLREPDQFSEVVQTTTIPGLSFISAGHCSTKGLAKLSEDKLHSLFVRLREEFEFVVVDASPILPVVDTRLFAQHVDGVVLSVLRDVSRVSQVRAATTQMESFGVSILGVVMIGSKRDAYPSAYSDYHDPQYADSK